MVIIIFQISCEYDPNGDNYHDVKPLPSEIKVSINLTDIKTGGIFYIYGTTQFQIHPEVGRIQSVEYTHNGKTIKQDNTSWNYYIDPEWFGTKESKDLKMTVTIIENTLAGTLGLGEYTSSVTEEYTLKYVRLTSEDFAIKSQEIDRIVLQMINKDHGPCKYVVNGEEIADLDNIVYKRDRYLFGNYQMNIYLLPESASIEQYYGYDYCVIEFSDKTLGDFSWSSVRHCFDLAHQELYTWSMSELFIHDKDLNILSKKMFEDLHDLMVTPKTGMVVCRRYNTITTYSDKSFSTIVSTISNIWPMGNLQIDERDQLFQGHNFQIDVFDLNIGRQIYTINLPAAIRNFSISEDGKYMLVFVWTNDEENCHIYSLDTNTASLKYSLKSDYGLCKFHPINKYHIIVYNYFTGFEIMDIETRQVLFKNKGGYQSVDPITGNLLYWDENYHYYTQNYQNHFIDKSYYRIYTLIDDTQSLYGAYEQFNNYLIKNTYYVNLYPQLTKK